MIKLEKFHFESWKFTFEVIKIEKKKKQMERGFYTSNHNTHWSRFSSIKYRLNNSLQVSPHITHSATSYKQHCTLTSSR